MCYQIHQFKKKDDLLTSNELATCMFSNLFSNDLKLVIKSTKFIKKYIKCFNNPKYINDSTASNLMNAVIRHDQIIIKQCILKVIYLFSKEFHEFFQLIIHNGIYELISNVITNDENQLYNLILEFLMNITSFAEGTNFINEKFGISFIINLKTKENTYKYKTIANIIYFSNYLNDEEIEPIFVDFNFFFQNRIIFSEMFICLYNLFKKSVKWQYVSMKYNIINEIQKLLSEENKELNTRTYLFIFKSIFQLIKSGINFDIITILNYLYKFYNESSQDIVIFLLSIIQYSIVNAPDIIDIILNMNNYDFFAELLKINNLNFQVKIMIIDLLYLIFKNINENNTQKIIHNNSFVQLIIQGFQISNQGITIKELKILHFLILNDDSFYSLNENSIKEYLNDNIVNNETESISYKLSEIIINEIITKTSI